MQVNWRKLAENGLKAKKKPAKMQALMELMTRFELVTSSLPNIVNRVRRIQLSSQATATAQIIVSQIKSQDKRF